MRHRAYNPDRGRVQALGSDGRNRGSHRYAAASLLARKGRYTDAVRLLSQAHDAGECSDAEALDLRARIYVQQGLYLEAESCWRRAQSIDGSNPAYADALYRLRQVRQPIQHNICRVAMVVTGLLFLGLLLWQVVFVNPASRRRLEAADQSLRTIRGEIGAFHHSSVSQDEALGTALAEMARDLQSLDNRLFMRIEGMPTRSGMNAGQEALIEHLSDRLNTLETATLGQLGGAARERSAIDHRIMALEEMITQRLADIGEQQAAADTGHLEQFKAVKAMMGPLGERLSGIESTIGRRVDTAESGVRQDMKRLASAADVGNLARSVSDLQETLGQLVAAIQELKQSAREGDGQAGGETGGDTEKPEEQGAPNDGRSAHDENGERELE